MGSRTSSGGLAAIATEPDATPLSELVAHISDAHHPHLGRSTAALRSICRDVWSPDDADDGRGAALAEILARVARTLDALIERERRELFPLLLAGVAPCAEIRRALEANRRDHLEVAALLRRLREAIDDWVPGLLPSARRRALAQEVTTLEIALEQHARMGNELARRSAW